MTKRKEQVPLYLSDEELAVKKPLGRAVKRLAQKRSFTSKMLAYDCGVNPQHMRTLFRGDQPFTAPRLKKVIEVLKLESVAETLYRQAAREQGFKIGVC
jgi:hypothetical protein